MSSIFPTFMVLLINITPLYVTNLCPFPPDVPLWPVAVSVVCLLLGVFPLTDQAMRGQLFPDEKSTVIY